MTIVPFDQRIGTIWYNGNLIPWQDGKIHIMSHGLHYASCVFEGVRVYNSKIFMLNDHSARLINSAKLLGFDIPYDVEQINQASKDVIKAQNLIDGYMRPVAWQGSEKMVIGARNSVHTAIIAWQWPTNNYLSKKNGIRVCIARWARPAPNTAPTNSKASGLYMISTMSKNEATDAGYDDALMLDYRGYIAEGTSSNIFFVIDGELHTPIADCFLNGITRQIIIKLAKENNIKVVERYITLDELSKVSEAFFTGTAAEITPIVEIADFKFALGDITTKFIQQYCALTKD